MPTLEEIWISNDAVAAETVAWIKASRAQDDEIEFEFKRVIDEAIARRDFKTLTVLTEDPRLRHYAFEKLIKKRGPARTRGQVVILEMAAELVDEIHQFWKQRFGKWKRRQSEHGPSLAIKIAADYYKESGLSISEDELATYIDKERHR